jgi:hypothetical protein
MNGSTSRIRRFLYRLTWPSAVYLLFLAGYPAEPTAQLPSVGPLDVLARTTLMLGVVAMDDSLQAFEPIGTGFLIWNYFAGEDTAFWAVTAKHVIVGRWEILAQRALAGFASPPKPVLVGVVSQYLPQVIRAADPQGLHRVTIKRNSGLTVIVPAERVLELIDYAQTIKQ